MEYLNIIFQEVYKILFLLVPVLVSVAMIVWLDRRVWAFVQKRQGPNVVGPFGLLQSLADALKYIFKEIIIPSSSNKVIFILAPIVTMTLALIAWAVIPFSATQVLADINVGILYLFAVSSLGVYGIIMGGWASNSKYPFLGAIRSAAQMVSYEVSIGVIIINVLLCVGSLNLNDIVEAQKNLWFVIPLFPMFVIFFISALAETNRPPFDLPEAEAELVAGYQTEYSGNDVCNVLARGIRKYFINVCNGCNIIFRWMDVSYRHLSFYISSRCTLVNIKNFIPLYFICFSESYSSKI